VEWSQLFIVSRRAVPAGAPRDVLGDLVARRTCEVVGEDGAERLAAWRVAEFAAGDVCGQLRVSRLVELRVQLQRRKPGLRARVVRQALHRELPRCLLEIELVGGRATGSARREQRRIGVVRGEGACRGAERDEGGAGQERKARGAHSHPSTK
jgi:hypothetical protein